MARHPSTTWHPILRSIQDHWVWVDKPFSYGQAWIDMILLAQHTPTTREVGRHLVPLEVGQLSWAKTKLAERWGWGRDRFDRFFTRMVSEQMISVQTSGKTSNKYSSLPTVITILNYKEIQESIRLSPAGKPAGTPAGRPAGTPAGGPAITQKGEKEDLSPPPGETPPGPDEKGEGLPPNMGAGQEPPAAAGNKPPREPNPIWDTICELFSLKPVEDAEKKRVGKVVATLKRKSATPEKIRAVYAKMDGSLDWAPFSPEGLVKWYDQLSAPAKPAVAQSTVYEPRL